MITIIMFFVGFYLGILLFALLTVASRKTDNKPLIGSCSVSSSQGQSNNESA